MAGFLDDLEIEIPCENCGRKTKKTIRWIKSNNEFVCACGTHISLDSSDFRAKIAKIERDLGNLGKSLK